MNDHGAPHTLEWMMRLSAVLGMSVLFVLMMKIVSQF